MCHTSWSRVARSALFRQPLRLPRGREERAGGRHAEGEGSEGGPPRGVPDRLEGRGGAQDWGGGGVNKN